MIGNQKNSILLKMLCISTMIISGLLAVVTIGAMGGLFDFFGTSAQIAAPITQNPVAKTSIFIMASLLGLFIISVTGAAMMLRRRRSGFVLYALSNGLLLVPLLISLLLVFNIFVLIAALLSTLYIILYASQLRIMNKW